MINLAIKISDIKTIVIKYLVLEGVDINRNNMYIEIVLIR